MSYWDKVLSQFSTMGADVKNLFSSVGELSDLKTKVKSSIIGAINEIHSLKTSWDEIQNIPKEFPPKHHTHNFTDIKKDVGVMCKTADLKDSNLNHITETGYYYQYKAGRSDLSYPDNASGILIVYEAGGIFQEYRTSGNAIYVRVRQGSAKWVQWKKLI